MPSFSHNVGPLVEDIAMKNLMRVTCFLALLGSIAFMPTDATSASKRDKNQAKKVVYVCACLNDRSCSCMTEAKMEGPCACGTQGGPPMKAVAPDSDWAKDNRDALAK
jgi:hypothetical protein